MNANLVLRIKDQDYGATDDDVGGCTLNLQRVATSKVFDDWIVISKDAKIHVRITYTPPALFHGRSWMHDTRPHIEDKTLTQISIPGAHDTCTSRIHAETSELCPDAPDIVKKLATWPGIASVLKKITAGWSRAQSHTVAELLDIGVRYLDVRICSKGDEIWTVHGMYSEPLATVFHEIARR